MSITKFDEDQKAFSVKLIEERREKKLKAS